MIRLIYRFLPALAGLMIYSNTSAQNFPLAGKLIDGSGGNPVQNAVVMMLSEKDSTLEAFTRTDKEGTFRFNNIPQGKYLINTSHPMYADYMDNINIEGARQNTEVIKLTNKSKLLENIIVQSGGAIRIKGDTTIYTADSFSVTANANVEELLKKLPGIQVDKDGTIKAMGEKVEQVLVDGEEFFGDDPGMAVKNLRADAVKEVQVFDKQSDQAAFTGIDDGKTKKAINLKLKEDKKKGYFGKVALSGGYAKDVNNRFNNNFMYGSFKGKRKFSAFLLNGNTGQDGLAWNEMQKYGGDEMNYEMMDEDGIFNFSTATNMNDGEINFDTRNGFIRNINSGLQYSNKWNDKHKINVTPKYNLQDYSNVKESLIQTQLGDSLFDRNMTTISKVDRYNLKNRFIYEGPIDSFTSVKLTLNGNYYRSESSEQEISSTKGLKGNLKNSSLKTTVFSKDKTVLSGTLLLKHKFRKNRRTLSMNMDWSEMKSDLNKELNSTNDQIVSSPVILDQRSKSNAEKGTFSTKFIYTEPLNKNWSMELSYQLSLNTDYNEQETFEKGSSNNYDKKIDSLTNYFDQQILVHNPGARFNYAYKKYKFNLGSGFGITRFDLKDLTTNENYDRQFVNLFPSATFVYAYKSQHSIRVKYNGSNQQPGIEQLQPLRNNTDFFNQNVGNPDLKPSFINNINITHNGYNFIKNKWFFQSININFTQNAITNNRVIDPFTGATVSKPINTDGNISAVAWMGLGSKHKKTAIQYQLNTNINYSRFADVINSNLSFAKTTGVGISLSLTKSKANQYDFSLSESFNYNLNRNAQSAGTNRFTTNTVNASALIYYKKTWSLGTEYEFYATGRINERLDPVNFHIVDMKLQRSFFKNELTVYVKIKDLFNENTGVDRSYFGNTFTEERNQRLRRYFMLGLSWDFKNRK
jgi:hypothetical protein